MANPGRRHVLGGLAALAVGGRPAWAAAIQDDAGRRLDIPSKVERVFPAGPPAAILLYTLAPDLLLGWPRANRASEVEFLLPGIGSRPELGRLTGRGNTANLEVVLQLKPDLILDVGSLRDTFVSLADRVQAQTGLPYALLDGRLEATAATYRTLGVMLGRPEKAADLASYAETTLALVRDRVDRVPADRRPRVYYARGSRGLETALGGSINVESLDRLGAVNVAGATGGGLANVSLEQVLAWNPDVIVTIDQSFAGTVRRDLAWAGVKAVRDGRVHLSPKLPFGWIDFPPSVNRLVGLHWLGRILYPDLFPEDVVAVARDFYARFYHVTPTDEALGRVLAGRE